MAKSGDTVQRQEDRVTGGMLFRERASARPREAVITAPPLPSTFDPASFDQALLFEAIERRIQRGGVKRDGAVRSLFDQLADLVAMALAFIQQRQDKKLRCCP